MNIRVLFFLITFLLVVLLAPFSASAYVFIRNLRQGDVGPDVMELQKILNTNTVTKVNQTGAGSPGSETTFFGPATKRAVIAFQELYKNEVLTPAGLSQGNGFVGLYTRQKLNTLSSGAAATTTMAKTPTQSLLSNVPVITHLSTTTINNGDRIVIYGKNFQPKNTVLISIEVPGKFVDIPTASATSMELTVNTTMSTGIKQQLSNLDASTHDFIIDKIKTKMNAQNPSTDGNWYFPATLNVKNLGGTSNYIPIKINFLKGV